MRKLSFTLDDFMNNPSVELVHACRKDDLLCIAAYFDIAVQKSWVKKEMKKRVLEELVNLKILSLSPAPPVSEVSVDVTSPSTEGALQSAQEPAALVTPHMDRGDNAAPATVPHFDPLSPPLPLGSSQDSELKVRLKRLQLEAQEKESLRKAEFDLRLQVSRFETEAEKEVWLKELDLEALKKTSEHTLTPSVGAPLFQMASKQGFDASKNICSHVRLCPVFYFPKDGITRHIHRQTERRIDFVFK